MPIATYTTPVALLPTDDTALTVSCCNDAGLTIMGIDAVPTSSLTLTLSLTKPTWTEIAIVKYTAISRMSYWLSQ